jgi:hypothetical protein
MVWYHNSFHSYRLLRIVTMDGTLKISLYELRYSRSTTRQATHKKILLLAINFGKSRDFSHDRSSLVVTCHQLGRPSRQLIL